MNAINLFFIITFILSTTFGRELSPAEIEITKYAPILTKQNIKLLEKIVNINSGSQNPEGVNKVGKILKTRFEKIGMNTKFIKLPKKFKRGDHLFASTKNSIALTFY